MFAIPYAPSSTIEPSVPYRMIIRLEFIVSEMAEKVDPSCWRTVGFSCVFSDADDSAEGVGGVGGD